MMLYPSIVDLLEKAGSKYSLVIAAAKRAREICVTSEETDEPLDGARGITKAAEEIADGTITVINYEGKDDIIKKLEHVNTDEYVENVMHMQMSALSADEDEEERDMQGEDKEEYDD